MVQDEEGGHTCSLVGTCFTSFASGFPVRVAGGEIAGPGMGWEMHRRVGCVVEASPPKGSIHMRPYETT